MEKMFYFDRWKTSHHNLKLPWTGKTTFDGRSCNDVDAHIDRLCNVKSIDPSATLDMDMPQSKSVRFDHSLDSCQSVTPYAMI